MNRDQSYALIRQTFTQGFDRTRFLQFIRNLLNHLDESKAAGMAVPDAFTSHIRNCQRLGTYRSPEGELADVLIVHTTDPHKITQTRTALRDFVAHKLKRQDSYKEAGLIAFVSPDARSWRFSYIRMEYETKRDPKTGKIIPEERLTPARRFSYIVGEGESCHTAQTRFLNLLQDTQIDPKLADIEEVFSVEAVTKEFFKRYAELFGDIHKALEKIVEKNRTIRDEFTAKSVSAVDFAKKLMGQIVFLYFLQKKGWLGVAKGVDWGSGPHDFLRRMSNDEYGKYSNFFNDILEPLFYDTLATDRGHEAWCNRFKCRIPFLNGGLFEPLGGYDWEKIDILLPNRLFTNADFVEEGITGTGVLDVFDRYNFTVNEAEPLEKEVAIDPEMLGKVFENLIEDNRRKGLGAYYTPREIVHYMCQESLINYLDTVLNTAEESVVPVKPKQNKMFGESEPEQMALKTTVHRKLVPREDIETFVHLGDQYAFYEAAKQSGTIGRDYPKPPKSIEQHARLIDEKLTDITVCDPAVGSGAFLVGMMAEIIRARFALTPYFNDIHERTPYHFKRHAIQNCLYGVDIDPGAVEIAKLRLWLSLVVDEEDVKQIKPLPNLDYKIVAGNSLLGVERTLFNEKLFKRLEELKPLYFDESDKDKKVTYKQEIDGVIHTLTSGKKSFDFEIFFSEVFHKSRGFDVVIANPPYGAKFSGQEKQLFLRVYHHQDYQLDSYLLFLERAFVLLREHGVLAFIIPNPWLTNLTLKKIRRFIFGNHTVHEIAHYSKKIFDAIVDTEVVIIKSGVSPGNKVLVRIVKERDSIVSQTVDQQKWASLNGEPVNIFSSPQDEKIIQKIKANTVPLAEICTVSNGMKSYEVGKGVPPQTKEMVSTRVYDAAHQKDRSYRPLLRGRDIERYINKWNGGRWIKYGDNLAAPRSSAQFDAPEKIVIRQTGDSLIATMDTEQFVCMNNMHTIVPKDGSCDLSFMLGMLNSRLLNYYFQWLNPERGEALAEIKKEHVEKLVIRRTSAKQQEPIIRIVNRTLTAKRRDPKADTAALEREIDRLVYELYGLTEEEIAIVEGTAK